MPVTEDLRKTLTDPTPLYFAAGTADLAAEKLREVPELWEKLRERAPQRLETVRTSELARLREQAQTLALQGVGLAVEYAVKAREAYVELADRGRGAVDQWRGGDDTDPGPAGYDAYEAHLEREPVDRSEPVAETGQPVSEAGSQDTGAAEDRDPTAEQRDAEGPTA